MSVMLMTSSIRGVTAPISAASRAAGASAIFHTVINAPKPKSGGLKDPDVSATGDIDLNNVNFAYPSRPGIKILNSLSLRFQAGKITALVGPSGSGKSTIVGLIERWYELDKGPMGYATVCSGLKLHDVKIPIRPLLIRCRFNREFGMGPSK